MTRTVLSLLLTALAVCQPAPARAGAPLETETARFAARGTLEAEAVYEFQTSKEGRETAVPLALEYALTDRIALMAEPVPYTRIRPNLGRGASGAGDLEVTCAALLRAESARSPALALAAEVKVPTGEAPLIGTDHFDYTGYAIASKRFGRLDAHANVGYTIIGHAADVAVLNTWNYALAGVVALSPGWQVVAELVGNTSALPETPGTESASTPEISAGETIAMLGARWALAPRTTASMGVTLDNNRAVLFRPGLTMRF